MKSNITSPSDSKRVLFQAILVVGDATAKRTTGSMSKKLDSQAGSGAAGSVKSELSISHILGTSDMGGELLMDLGYDIQYNVGTCLDCHSKFCYDSLS